MRQSALNFSSKTIYFTIVFFVALESMNAWFFWPVSNRFLMPLLFAILTFFVSSLNQKLFLFNSKVTFFIICLFLLARFSSIRGNVNAFLGEFIVSTNIFLFFFLNKKGQILSIKFFSNAMGLIVGLSLFAWVLFLLGVKMPYFHDTYGFSDTRLEAQYIFNNYYFFLHNLGTSVHDLTDLLIPRFSSIFLEPGYLSMLLVILLYVNSFDFKRKYNIVFLIALFFSFSLAGWLLGLYSYMIFALRNHRSRIKIVLFVTIGLYLLSIFFVNYKHGENPVNEFIIERLKFDNTKGTIAGYNRTIDDFDKWFEQSFLRSPDLIFGTEYYQKYFGGSTNVGWKPYVAQYGFFGLATYLIFLFYVFYINKNFITFGFFILYIAIFSRGHHEVFWAVFPILFVGGCSVLGAKRIFLQKFNVTKV